MSQLRGEGANLRILIVDDDEDDFVITRDLLRERLSSCLVTWANSFREGVRYLSSGNHDLAIVDFRLGAETGLDLLEKGGQLDWHIPIILLTGTDNPNVDHLATEGGAADYLVKQHLDATALERAVRYAVARAEILAKSRESEQRFRSIVENANDAIVITDDQQHITLWNPAAASMFGFTVAAAIGASLPEILALRQNGNNDVWGDGFEAIATRIDGRALAVEISSSTWAAGRGLHASHIIRDVTERAQLQRQLREQASTDSLTGLPNRASFRRALESSANDRDGYAALFIDLDDFKLVNDRLGHAAGDEVLRQAAHRIRAKLRKTDVVARLGGDEFAVLIRGVTRYEAIDTLVADLLSELGRPYEVGGDRCNVGASIGAALHHPGRSPIDVLQDADVAMYSAKAKGKGQAERYSPVQRSVLMLRHELARTLRDTPIVGGFEVHYQPIVNLAGARISGVEALLRWRHPTLGLLSGDRFISLAEESGLIVPVGVWVLEQAAHQLRRWRDELLIGDDFTMSVNVAARQLLTADFSHQVHNTLDDYAIAPRMFCLEVTESTLLDDDAVRLLASFRDEGLSIAIDDFGAGYSSLASLLTYPATIAKIDRSLVTRLLSDERASTLLHGILALTSKLGFSAVAEGIETQGQVDLLGQLGCQQGQGYFLGRPAPATEIASLLLPAAPSLSSSL